MAFAGDLESFSLADVFQKVQTNQETGVLRVDDGKRPFLIFFLEGKVKGVQPEKGVDAFSRGVLLKRGGLDPGKLEKALKRHPQAPITAAWKAGLLPDSDARSLFEFYASERVFDLFAVDLGSFKFEDSPPAAAGPHTLREEIEITLDPGKLLFEGARRNDEWKQIKRKVISSSEVFVPNPKKEGPAEDGPEEERDVYGLLDGKRSVADVTALSPESRFTVYKALVSLMTRSLVAPLTPDDAVGRARRFLEAGRYDDAIKIGQKGLETERNNPKLRRIVADALTRKGEKQRAAGELKLLAYSAVDNGELARARQLYDEVIALDPRDFDARERLFHILTEQGDFTDALQQGAAFASAAEKYGAIDRAQSILSRLTDLSGDRPPVWEALADIAGRIGQTEEAAKLWRRSARAHLEEERWVDAKAAFEKLLKFVPGDDEAQRCLEEIETGRAAKRARRSKLALRIGLIALVLVAAVGWLAWDWNGHRGYAAVVERAMALSLEGKHLEAAKEARDFARSHPLTLASGRALRLGWACEVRHLLKSARSAEDPQERDRLKRQAAKMAEEHLPADSPLRREIK